jgi:hypothetical protein
MSIRVNIWGDKGLWPGRNGPFELERALNDYLQDRGEVVWGGEDRGPGWMVEVLLHGEPNVDEWVAVCARFLRSWGVPADPISFLVWREDNGPSEYRRLVVPEE